MERKVFDSIPAIWVTLDLASTYPFGASFVAAYFIGKANRDALAQREEEIKAHEVTAAWCSPVALP